MTDLPLLISTLEEGGEGSREVDSSGARKKGVYVGAPACFALELACQHLNAAFGGFGCYLVGSALERPDWRDIDVRLILEDAEFVALFPDAGPVEHVRWEFDPRWLVLTTAISAQLSAQTGLPVDFQFQPQSHANKRHKGRRSALGMRFAPGVTEPAPATSDKPPRRKGAAVGAVNRERVLEALQTFPGIDNAEIGERLGLSAYAVGRHVASIRAGWSQSQGETHDA